MDNKIYAKHTSVVIPNYTLGSLKHIENSFTVFDKMFVRGRTIYKTTPYYLYDEESKTMTFPRGCNPYYISKQLDRPVQMVYEPDTHEPMSMIVKTQPRDTIQEQSIKFLIDNAEFSQIGLTLDPGDGKTFCVISALSMYKSKAIVITHQEKIKNQWKESIVKFSNVVNEEIFDLDSSATIEKLIKKGKSPYKIYLVNHRTIFSYAKKHGWEAITELFKFLKVGVKVIDEAHKEFANTVKIDAFTNTKRSIYLSATFQKTGFEADVFKNTFSNARLFGYDIKANKTPHIEAIMYQFNSKPDMFALATVKTNRGFNRHSYSDYHYDKPILFKKIDMFLEKSFNNKGYKTLVLFSKIDMIEKYFYHLEKYFPDKNVLKMHSKTKVIPEQIVDADIILATADGIGTGTDIFMLRYVIMTEQYTSTTIADQVSGRLRRLGPDISSYYIEIMDVGFPDVKRMYKARLKVFKTRCKKITLIEE